MLHVAPGRLGHQLARAEPQDSLKRLEDRRKVVVVIVRLGNDRRGLDGCFAMCKGHKIATGDLADHLVEVLCGQLKSCQKFGNWYMLDRGLCPWVINFAEAAGKSSSGLDEQFAGDEFCNGNAVRLLGCFLNGLPGFKISWGECFRGRPVQRGNRRLTRGSGPAHGKQTEGDRRQCPCQKSDPEPAPRSQPERTQNDVDPRRSNQECG